MKGGTSLVPAQEPHLFPLRNKACSRSGTARVPLEAAGTLLVAAVIGFAAYPNLGANAARGFQEAAIAMTVLRGDGQRIFAVCQRRGQQEGQLGGLVDGDIFEVEGGHFAFGIGEGDTHGGVVAYDLQHRAAHEEVLARRRAAVLEAGLAVFGLEDVHHVSLLAQDVDGGLLDGFAEVFTLREGDVDIVFLGIPDATLDHASQLRLGVEQSRVHVIST